MPGPPAKLGIGPTVTIRPNNADNKASYVYQVNGGEPLFFRTVQALSLQRPLGIAGRLTRMWKVIQVSSADGKTVVDPEKVGLKDT